MSSRIEWNRTVIYSFAVLAFLSGPAAAQHEGEPYRLVVAFERYCLEAAGDHSFTLAVARADGFIDLRPEDFPGLRLPGIGGFRGMTRTIGSTEYRVITANYQSWLESGNARWRHCWVSASDADIDLVNDGLRDLLDVSPFRIRKAKVFAWIPAEDGPPTRVSRSVWNRRYQNLARRDGLRYVTTAVVGTQVSVSFAMPRDWVETEVPPEQTDTAPRL